MCQRWAAHGQGKARGGHIVSRKLTPRDLKTAVERQSRGEAGLDLAQVSPTPRFCHGPGIGQRDAGGMRGAKGEKSSSRSPAARQPHRGGGTEGCGRCSTPSPALGSQSQAGLWQTSAVSGPQGMIFGTACDAGEELAPLCQPLPAQPRRARPPLPLPAPCSS